MTGNKNIRKETTRELVARKPVRSTALNHLAQSITDNAALGRLLAGPSTQKPLDATFPDVDKDLPPQDDVTL